MNIVIFFRTHNENVVYSTYDDFLFFSTRTEIPNHMKTFFYYILAGKIGIDDDAFFAVVAKTVSNICLNSS